MPTSAPESQALLRRYRNANGFRGHPNHTHASLRASFSVPHITPPGAVLVELTLQTQGKTINREVVIALDEKSVKTRKVRKKSRNDFMKCTQTAYIFYNSHTQVNYRENKHFPGTSNMSSTCDVAGVGQLHQVGDQGQEGVLGGTAPCSRRPYGGCQREWWVRR